VIGYLAVTNGVTVAWDTSDVELGRWYILPVIPLGTRFSYANGLMNNYKNISH
jgi:hypothetical protein